MVKLQNVIQGSADVADDNGQVIGSVAKSESHRGWFAYGKDGKRISDDVSPKRAWAVREVVAAKAN